MEKQLLVKNRKLITVIILSAIFISMMSQTMMVTALPLLKDIMKESLTTYCSMVNHRLHLNGWRCYPTNF